MQSTASQNPKDCVVVGLANADKRPYNDVLAELETINKRLNPTQESLISRTGIPWNVLTSYLDAHDWIKRESIPRRGQDKISGLVRLISNKNVSGHLVYMQNGIVFDAFYPNGISIKEYQSRSSKCHIHTIWNKMVKIDTSVFDPSIIVD